jgi:hypothetical protein
MRQSTKMRMPFIGVLIPMLVSALFITGCASKVRIPVEQQPPVIPTAGITRIAVMPFESPSGANYFEMANYATELARNRIKGMEQFTLVDHTQIRQLQENNQDITPFVDAILTGRINRITTTTSRTERNVSNMRGPATRITYTTTGNIEFNYRLTRARGGSVVGRQIEKKQSISGSNQDNPPDVNVLTRSAINQGFRDFNANFMGTTVYQSREFATDRNEAIATDMRTALDLVKSGKIADRIEALDLYLRIYEEHRSVAAGINAAILYDSFGNRQAASDLLQRVYSETGDARARKEMVRLQ